jgi:hypothetical protein
MYSFHRRWSLTFAARAKKIPRLGEGRSGLRKFTLILIIAAAHFTIAMAIAVIAFGFDMDQLSSRNVASRAAASVHDVLWTPHDAALRSLPNDWIVRNRWVIPLAIVANSLAWGAGLYLAGRLFIRRR